MIAIAVSFLRVFGISACFLFAVETVWWLSVERNKEARMSQKSGCRFVVFSYISAHFT